MVKQNKVPAIAATRARNRQQTEAEILDAGARVLARDGFTSICILAGAAGC